MKNNLILSLIKYNLKKCYKKKIIFLTFFILLIVCTFYMDSVSEYFIISKKEVNQWDYFFRIFSNGFLLTWLIMPIMFLVTVPVSSFHNNNKYIFIRCKKKFRIFIAQQITNLLIITLYITTIGICIFLLGIYYSKFGFQWSMAIQNEKNVEILSKYLYFSNFIATYSPIKSMFITLFEFITINYIFILLRDVLIIIFKKNIIAISICFTYIIINAKSIVVLRCFSIGYLGTIWCHKFHNTNNLSLNLLNGLNLLSINQAILVSIAIIILLFLSGVFILRWCEFEKI